MSCRISGCRIWILKRLIHNGENLVCGTAIPARILECMGNEPFKLGDRGRIASDAKRGRGKACVMC